MQIRPTLPFNKIEQMLKAIIESFNVHPLVKQCSIASNKVKQMFIDKEMLNALQVTKLHNYLFHCF